MCVLLCQGLKVLYQHAGFTLSQSEGNAIAYKCQRWHSLKAEIGAGTHVHDYEEADSQLGLLRAGASAHEQAASH